MSKEYGNIDELFKAELGGSAPKTPAHVKKNIDKALGFGSGKKFLWILIPVLVALIATPFIYSAFQQEDLALSSKGISTVQNSPNIISENNQSNKITSNQNRTNQSTTLENIEVTSELSSSNAIENSNKSGNSTSTFGTGDNGNSTLKFGTINSNPKKDGGNTSNSIANTGSNGSTTLSTRYTSSTKNTKHKDDLEGSNIKTTTPATVKIDPNSTNEISPEMTTSSSSDSTNTSKTKFSDPKDVVNNSEDKGTIKAANPKTTLPPTIEKDTNTIVSENNLSQNPPVDTLTTSENTDTTELVDKKELDTSSTVLPTPIDAFEDPYKPWMLSLTTGINFKKSLITTTNLADTGAYNNTLNDRIGHSASFDVQYRLRNSLTFGAGVGYTTQIENYNYFKSEITSDSALYYVYFQDSIPDSSGWIYFQDSTAQYSYTTDTNEIYNANGRNINTFLHIPISIGTQLRFNKFLVDLYAMGRFNLLLISKTTYVQNDQIVTSSLSNIKRSYFDLVIGTNVHYNLVGNLYLTGTLRYRAPFNSPYYVNGVSNRFSNLHVGLGISLNL